MIKIILILSLILSIGCSKTKSSSNGKDNRELLLKNIKKGNLGSLIFEPNNIDVFTLGEDAVTLMVKRKRMEFPTFSEMNLYSAVAYDENYQYSIFQSLDTNQCLLYVNSRENLKRSGECFTAFNKCVGAKKIADWDEDLVSKCSNTTICKNLDPLDKGSVIEDEYCTMIYGK